MQNGYLGEFDIYTGRFTQFPAFDAEGKQLSVARIHTIFRRDMNRYMIGSDSGLFFFSRKNGRWSVSGDNLAEESIYRCFRDREGGIWSGTYFCGVNYLSPRRTKSCGTTTTAVRESLDGNAVSSSQTNGGGTSGRDRKRRPEPFRRPQPEIHQPHRPQPQQPACPLHGRGRPADRNLLAGA